jgi:hypothetical protein
VIFEGEEKTLSCMNKGFKEVKEVFDYGKMKEIKFGKSFFFWQCI